MKDVLKEMLVNAKKAMANAYNPYSGIAVGACIRSTKLYVGCNIENVSYSITLCAEASAIAAMISAGSKRISEVLIVSNQEYVITPCGACRQRLIEFANPDVKVHMFSCNEDYQVMTVGELLPCAFE